MEDFEVYVFGSVISGNYSIGLSDIDVAIVSDEFSDRNKKLKIYDLLFEKYFNSPFEFHLLTKKSGISTRDLLKLWLNFSLNT